MRSPRDDEIAKLKAVIEALERRAAATTSEEMQLALLMNITAKQNTLTELMRASGIYDHDLFYVTLEHSFFFLFLVLK
jgi:hypothetical protein